MKRSRAFNAVCGHLRAGLLGARSPGWHPWLEWESLVEVSRSHYVSPALAWCLRNKSSLPAELRGYCEAVLMLNGKRNEKLLKGLARVAAVLNAIDIEPVLLKGAAHLVECIYPAPSIRTVGDLDVLVPEDRVKCAAEALKKIGFKVGGPEQPENHHHWPMLFDPETGAAVELHMGALHRRSEHIIPAAEFHKNTRPLAFRGCQLRLPDATRTIGHNIVHDPLDHDGHLRQRVELRQLLDLAMIRIKHETAIDWTELDRRFSAAGVGHVLVANLKVAESLFGLRVPRIPLSKRQCAARRRILIARRRILIASMSKKYLAARRRDPWGVFNLFRPNTWPSRISRVRAALATDAIAKPPS